MGHLGMVCVAFVLVGCDAAGPATDPAGEPDVVIDAPVQDVATPAPDVAPDPVAVEDGAHLDVAAGSPWPVNPDKDKIADPGWNSTPEAGAVLPNFQALDQYGNLVEVYDFAGQGKPIVIDVGTWFCEPCKSLAWYLSTHETGPCPHSDTILEELGWWNEKYEVIYDLVAQGDLIWITILYSLGTPVEQQDVALWHEVFPHDKIPVLADTSLELQDYLTVKAMPRLDVLDEHMVFLAFEPGGPVKGLKKVLELFPDAVATQTSR